MNYLLPHIRRIPEALARGQFAHDAAQKLSIDSAVLREELRQAALKRRDHVEVKTSPLTEVERVLLRALAIIDPEHEEARRLAAAAIQQQPAWFEQLMVFPALQALATRNATDPMDVVEDEGQRALLAQALLGETRSPGEPEVSGALQHIHEEAIEHRRREVLRLMAEAERKGNLAQALALTQEKLQLDRALRELHQRGQE
jgi:DNA primase